MRKFLKLFVILIVSLMVMVACGNDDTSTKNNGNENIDSTSETDQTENDDVEDDSNREDDENGELDSSDVEFDDEVSVLLLGETGVIEDTLGIYEVTPKSFRFTDLLGEGSEEKVSRNGILVIVEIDIKNIGSETLSLESITKADIFTDTGGGASGFSNHPDIIQFQGEIEPGENFVGHILFDTPESGYYELAFGAHMPSHISNEVRWALHAEDAE